ncbi:MAG: hypothetical protein IKM66_10830 [Clostridia bacterium]|nr:hypothetical protein [Clostridia bacterium]
MKMLKKTLCVFLSVLMLFSALSVSLVAFAEDISYRTLAYSFFKYRTDNSGFTSVYVVETDENGFPVTSIVGDMDHYELSNSSDEYKYADDNENPIRAISYDHKVTAKDNSAGTIRNAAREYLSIVDKLMSTEYGVGLYTIPMIADEVANALKFTKGDDGNYLFLDGYTYVEDAVGKIVGRSPEKTYRVVDGEVEELDVSDSWMKEYGEGYNFITLYDYCNVATIIDYFSGNCTSVNSGSWFHSYTFHCYTDVDTVLTTETLVNQPLTVRHFTVEWLTERQYDDSGLIPQYYNGGYIITEDRTSTDNIRRDLVSMQTAFNGYFQRYYADGFLKNVKNHELISSHYNDIMEHYDLFNSLSNAAKIAVFGQSAYSYMHLVTQLTPIIREDLPANPLYWPKHTYSKYQDNAGNDVVYQVDAYGVTSIVSTIDSLLTNEKLGGIVKSFLTLSDPIKAQQAKTPKDVLNLFISDMLFQDSIINMLVEMLYPMVSELIDGMLTDQFINETLEDVWSGLDDIVDFVVDQGAGWQATIYAALASIGITLTPAGMAFVWNKYGYLNDSYGYTTTFPKFREMHDMLKAARGGITESGDIDTGDYAAIGSENDGYCEQRWKDVDFSKLEWGINGDKDKFLKALDAILAPLAPLLAVLLGNSASTIKVADVLLTPLSLILNDDSITHNYYDRILLPVFQVLGINKADHGLLTGREFEAAADAIRSDSSRNPNTISNFLNNGILNPLLNWVTETVLVDPISTVLSLLPNLSYFLTSGIVLNAVNSIEIPIRISHAIMFGAKATVYTLKLSELLGDDTIGFLDSLQGIIELIGIDVDTGIPIVGYHAEGQSGVYKPGMALYNPDIHNIPVSEAYISSAGEMSLYQDTTEFTTKISGIDANGNITEYAVCNEIGWKDWKGEVKTELTEEDKITFVEAVTEYYEYTVTTDEGEVTYKVAAKENLPQDILDSGDYSHVRDVVTLSAEAALPPIMDYKLQAIGTLVTETNCGRYSTITTNDGNWGEGVRKYIKLEKEVINIYDNNKVVQMETTGLVLVFLFRYILSAVMYRPYSGSSFTSDYTLLDAFGLDDETLNDELFAGLKLKDIIDNVALHPDAALAALLELLYKNEFGSLYKVDENGNVVVGDDYAYDIHQIDYHAEEILGAAEAHNDYTYGTAILYTEKWTKDQAEYIVDNLNDIVEDVFAMLKMDGMESLGGFLEDMVTELLFTNDMISDLAGMLYGLLSDLGGDIDIMAILDAALGVQITKQALADALIYEFGNDAKTSGSYVDENGETVTVKSVYTKLYEDIQTGANYRNEANRALAAGDNALYEELLAKAAETEKFTDATFYKTGVVENDVIDEETGEPTGETIEETVNLFAYDWGYNNPAIKAKYSDAEIFLKAASAVLSPFAILIKFIFMGDDLMLLKSSEDAKVGLVNIPSYEVYHYAWIPLMETLGATNGLVSFKTYFEKVFNGESEVAQNCDAIYYLLKPIIGLAESVFENPVDVVLNLIPNLLFFISIGGLNGVVNNIAHFAYVLLDILSPLVDAYPIVNSLLANIRIGDMALNLSLPLDVDFNQLVNQLLEGLLGESLSFDIENSNLVVGTQEVEKEVFEPTLDADGNEQFDEEGNVIGEMVMKTVTEDVYAVGTLSIKLPFIDFTTLCAGTVQGRTSVSGNRYVYLDTGGGADLITLIFRLVTDTLFFEDNAVNIANFLIGFAQLDDKQDNDDLLLEIFTYLNMKANEADAPDIVMNILYYIIRFLVPIADELGSRFKRVDFSITDMFEDTDNIMNYISALMDDGGPPNETLSGFARLIKLIQEFFNKIAEFFRQLFGG